MNQLTLDYEPLPERLIILEQRAREEIATPKMLTAGLNTMFKFTTERLRMELRR